MSFRLSRCDKDRVACNFGAASDNQQLLLGAVFNICIMESQLEILKQRAEKGDATAQWDLAKYYCEHPDQGGLYDWINWARKAAEQGHPEAEVCVGKFCEDHFDEPQAAMWYERAAMQGYTQGDYYLGLYYKEGRGGLPRDLKQAEQCFLRASRYVEAAYEYYECYRLRTGDDWEENEKEVMQACRLLKGSADGGYAPAQYTLGMLYESYNDPEEAQTYLKAAAKQGHAAAVEYLCTMYAQQYMAAGDFKKALKYLKKRSKRDGRGICAYMCGDFWEHNYRGLLPWDDNQPNRASRTSIASHWYSYSYLRGYKPALEHVIRCFLITNKVEPTTENIASVESFLKNGCLILTYKNIRTIYYDIYPGW